MFTHFIHNIYPIFMEEEFELLSEDNEENIFFKDVDMVRFVKRQNTMLYMVNFWDLEKIDLETFLFRNNAYKRKLNEVFNQLNCSYLIVLNLLVTEEEIPLLNPEIFQPNKEVYTVSWIIDLQYKKIIVPKKEIDDIINIRELIEKVFYIIDPSYDFKENDKSNDKDKRKKKTILRQKSKNTFLTFGLMGLNIIIWIIMELNGGSKNVNTLLLFGANEPFLIIGRSQYWRLIASMFLHIGLSHLLYNLFALYIFGIRIEKYYGKIKFLMIYFISGIIGSIASIFFSDTVSAGASGAIYGLIGALLIIAYKTKKQIDGLNTFTLLIMVMIGIAFGFMMPSVDNAAHLGGLLSGIVSGTIILQNIKEKE